MDDTQNPMGQPVPTPTPVEPTTPPAAPADDSLNDIKMPGDTPATDTPVVPAPEIPTAPQA